MAENDSSELERIFNLVYDAPRAERAAILDRECGDNVELRRELEAMIAGAEDERFLTSPIQETWDPAAAAALPDEPFPLLIEQPGSRIGPYKLLQLLGEGGFGSVFMADQEKPVARKVALKIIKLGMDTKQVVARFEQERQALALMDHPHVARVFDAGSTETGRPYFVMELCTGEAITEYCDKHSLSISDRLSLFVQVCQAVQHAHQKGLIHRDIKPSNILVHTQDGRPHAKIIDFGIAKATASKLTEKTLFTEHKQLIGTPEYMSPEQAEGSLDIDTRTDVYSLGVLLYELLTGSTPFDSKTLRSAAYGEIQRIIREVDPPKPSTRLQQSGDTIASVAARRDLEPRKLGTIVRGELDWIVMKSLEKDRQRRYDSANALGADVQRYLAGEAVVAAPASKTYLLRKFVRRNKGVVTAVAAVMVALSIGAAAFAWQAHRAAVERDKAQNVAEFMSEILHGVGPSVARGRDVTMLKEMMDAAAARIEQGVLRGSPEAELQLRDTIGDVYRDLSLYPESARLLEPAVPLARSLHRGDHADTARALDSLGHLNLEKGDLAAAEPLMREAMEMYKRLSSNGSLDAARTMSGLGVVVQARGDVASAETLFRDSNSLRKRLKSGDDQDFAANIDCLGNVLFARGDLPGAEAQYVESLAMYRRLFPGDHPETLIPLTNLANTLQSRGDLAGAEKLFVESLEMRRRLFPHDHAETAIGLTALGVHYFARGDYARAEPLFREALEIDRKLYGSNDHEQTSMVMGNLATVLHSRGDLAGAETLFLESIAMKKRLAPPGSADIARSLCNLALLRRTRNDPVGAEAACREAVEMLRRLFPGDHPQVALALHTLALVFQDREDYDGAERSYRQAVDMWRRLFHGDHQSLANGLTNLATLLIRRGNPSAAEPMAREAVGMFQRVNGPNFWLTGTAHLRLGQALCEMKRFANAEPELIEAQRVLSSAQGAPAAQLQDCVRTLISLYEAWEVAEPQKGHAAKAAEWQAKLATTTRPTSRPTSRR